MNALGVAVLLLLGQVAIAEEPPGLGLRLDPEGPRAVAGYVGPHFNPEAHSERVVVLAGTLRQGTGPQWTMQGFIRNETGGIIHRPRVTAVLRGAGRMEIARAEAWVPIESLRPGEPAPFVVTMTRPLATVASAEWEVRHEPEPAGRRVQELAEHERRRSFELDVYWTRPYGDSERLNAYPQVDPATGPLPYVMFGSLRNVGSYTATGARVIAAWLDGKGRVVHVAGLTLKPTDDERGAATAVSLPARQQVDFHYSNADPAVAPLLDDATLVLWAVSHE